MSVFDGRQTSLQNSSCMVRFGVHSTGDVAHDVGPVVICRVNSSSSLQSSGFALSRAEQKRGHTLRQAFIFTHVTLGQPHSESGNQEGARPVLGACCGNMRVRRVAENGTVHGRVPESFVRPGSTELERSDALEKL